MTVSSTKAFRPARLGAYLTAALVPAVGLMLSANVDATPAVSELTVVTAITLPGKPLKSFDISFVNAQLGIYILGDRSNKAVDVINTKNNTVIGQWTAGFVGTVATCGSGNANDCAGPDGVLIANNKEIWVGDGTSTMKVISLFNGALAATINTGGSYRVDEMCLDPVHGIVMAANNAEDPPFVYFFHTRLDENTA